MSSTFAQGTRSAVASRRGGGGERSMVPPGEPRSYYGEPVVARPVWSWEIPWYFWTGGLAGASAPLSTLARWRGHDVLARRAMGGAIFGAVTSPLLLISDLGRPARFLNMLRMFKVTSPMSVGSWILSAYGTTTALAAAREWLGILPRAGAAGQAAGLVLGPALSTYTATLVANTAIPVWHEAGADLPFVFAASSAASAGAMGALTVPVRDATPARRLAVLGAVAELALVERMQRRLGPLGRHYHEGEAGRYAQVAKGLTAGGMLAIVAARGRRLPAALGGVAILGGALAERWSIFKAGFASADDPRDTVGPQRDRLNDSDGQPTSYVRVTQHGSTPNDAGSSSGRVEVEQPEAPRA